MIEELRETPEESYHKKLGEMIKKVKAETKWRDIFKIVEESQMMYIEKDLMKYLKRKKILLILK